jgi:hypothetical protein
MIAILFWSMSLSACVYALLLGGWEGRWTTLIIILASLATLLANHLMRSYWSHLFWVDTNLAVLAIDLVTFLAMYVIAAKSMRWWPIWVAAFQLNSVVAHVATTVDPAFSAIVYQGYEGMWAIPGQLVMIFGIYRDRLRKTHYDLA